MEIQRADNLKYRLLNWGLGILLSFLLYGYVVHNIPYQLCELEHENLFVADADTWMSVWAMPGGLAEVLCLWLTQFLAVPYVGSLIFLLPVLLLWPVTVLLLKRTGASSVLIHSGASGVVVAQLFTQYDFNFYESGSIAMLAALLCLYAISYIKHLSYRWAVFIGGIPCVAWLFGSIVVMYVVYGSLLFFFASRQKYMPAVSLLALGMVLVLGNWLGCINKLELFISPAFYYRPLVDFPVIHWISWGFPIFLLVVVGFFPHWGASWKPVTRGIVISCLWGLVFGVFLRYESLFRNTSNQTLWQLNHYSFREEWKDMLDFLSSRQPITNQLYMNYANMALAQTGHLGDYAFHFSPRGIKSLLVEANSTASVYMLMSDVQYTIGGIADSQRYAFEAQTALPRMCGVQILMRLVKTNLILGHDMVAEKYLALLEKTLFYKKWAQHYRMFLHNPQAVEADEELGEKRRGLSKHNRFVMSHGWNRELEDVLQADPSNKKVVAYLGLSYLLAKDLQGYRHFLETYYGTEALETLPLAFQQGVIAAYPEETEKWEHYRVTSQVKDLYVRYVKQLQGLRGYPGKKRQMKREYGYTFWYYYMFI